MPIRVNVEYQKRLAEDAEKDSTDHTFSRVPCVGECVVIRDVSYCVTCVFHLCDDPDGDAIVRVRC